MMQSNRNAHEGGVMRLNPCPGNRVQYSLYLYQFASLGEARRVIGAFIHRYNTEWLIARLGYRTPAAARAAAWAEAA